MKVQSFIELSKCTFTTNETIPRVMIKNVSECWSLSNTIDIVKASDFLICLDTRLLSLLSLSFCSRTSCETKKALDTTHH